MIRLVVNADDLGLHPRVDEGILRAHRDGILTSATVLVTGNTAEVAVRRAQEQELALGVHLCLCTGLRPALPLGKVRSLAPTGVFRPSWAHFARAAASGQVRFDEVREELRAQVERTRVLGFEPDHLDAHQHLHLLPGIATVFTELADEVGLPMRWPRDAPSTPWLRTPGAAAKAALLGALSLVIPRPRAGALRAFGVYESGALDEATLLRVIERIPDGDHELISHPGEDPGVIPEDPPWKYAWSKELEALCSPKVRQRISERGIELTTYGRLFASNRT